MPGYDEEAIYRSALDGFMEIADTYDARMAGAPTLLLESTETLSALPDLTDATVVDFGCGTGRYALQMARMGARKVVGVDFASEMLTIAQRKVRRAEDADELSIAWVTADITQSLPLDRNNFDAAVCALALSFIPEVGAAFTEMAQVLKPGAVLIVSDYHPHILRAARALSLSSGRRDGAPFLRFTSADGEECRVRQIAHQISDLFTAAKAAGLTLEHIAEPTADRRLCNNYPSIRDLVDVPLALILRFRKSSV